MSIPKNKTKDFTESEYLIEKIMDKKTEKGKPKYLIKWLGYPHCQNTWEPLSHLQNCIDLVEEFENSKKNKDDEKLQMLNNKRNRSYNDNYERDISASAGNKSFTKNARISFEKANEKALSEKKQVNIDKQKYEVESLKAKSKEEKTLKADDSKKRAQSVNMEVNSKNVFSCPLKKSYNDKNNNRINHEYNNHLKINKNSNNLYENDMLSENNLSQKININNNSLNSNGSLESLLLLEKEKEDNNVNKRSLKLKRFFKDDNDVRKTVEVFENIEPAILKVNDHFNFNQRVNSHQKKKIKSFSNIFESLSEQEDLKNPEDKSISILNTTSRKGEFGRDKPKRIISSKIIDGKLICCIEWKQLNHEEIILPSEYDNNRIKLYDSFLLLDFYEKRLKFKSEK